MSSEIALPEIHHRKSEIVENVAGGDRVVELDGVERRRLAVNQREIAEMQIAVATPDPPARAARAQQRRHAFERRARTLGERGRRIGGKQIRPFGEASAFCSIQRASPRGRARPADLGLRVHGVDRRGEFADRPALEFAARGELVERRFLVEAAHPRRPFDDLAVAVEP